MSSVELQYLEKIASELERARVDPYGEHAANVAKSIEASGLAAQVGSMGQSISRVAAMAEWALPAIAREIAKNSTLLEELIGVTASPRSTAARESSQMGLNALRNGWSKEAIEEFSKALEDNRYDAGTHLALGCAHIAVGDYDAASDSFTAAVRYGLPTSRPVACGAALLGAQTLIRNQDRQGAIQLLDVVRTKITNCPEVDLAFARLTDDISALRRALRIAPELAIDAAAAGISGTQDVCIELLMGVEKRLHECRRLLDEVADMSGEPSTASRFYLENVDVAATYLVSAGQVLEQARRQLSTESESLHISLQKKSSELQSASSRAEYARNEAKRQKEKDAPIIAKGNSQRVGCGATTLLMVVLYAASCNSYMSTGDLGDGTLGLGLFAGLLFWICLFWSFKAVPAASAASAAEKRRPDDTIHKSEREIAKIKPKQDRLGITLARYEKLKTDAQSAVNQPMPYRTVPFLSPGGAVAGPRAIT